MKIEELIDRGDETGQRIRETLNVLLESPYFYKTDDDRENLRFRFGDWLEYAATRFRALMSGKEENYTDERVRQILRDIMPDLVRYRFLQKVRPSADDSVSESETIFECLPALWHYQAAQLNQPVESDERGETGSVSLSGDQQLRGEKMI